jgi:hypothetical protein
LPGRLYWEKVDQLVQNQTRYIDRMVNPGAHRSSKNSMRKSAMASGIAGRHLRDANPIVLCHSYLPIAFDVGVAHAALRLAPLRMPPLIDVTPPFSQVLSLTSQRTLLISYHSATCPCLAG